jgi:O-antigen/teichoic acid export membrane protein
LDFTFSGKTIAKNTLFNLIGYLIPILFAIGLIPLLLTGLGKERFGILNLVWIVIGYFSFFDFGLGRSLTKIVSEKIGLNQLTQVPKIFWSSLILMFFISLLISLLAVLFIPSLLNEYLNISENLKAETYEIFFMVSLSVPIITTSAGLRGVIEAYQRFDVVNVIRVFLGILTFLGPLIVLVFTNSLYWIVVFLIIVRLIVWLIYFFFNVKLNKEIIKEIKFNFASIKPLMRFGFWISIANLIGPLILYSDRFLIGAFVSAVAITYYAVPYEIITKLLIIPTALVTVLFPVFSISFAIKPDESKNLLIRGIKYVFLIVFPIVVLVITFAEEGMTLWVGAEFSAKSAPILQILSVGILMNCLSLIPNIFFQGTGKPKIPTLINLVELPFYLLFMWLMIKNFNIIGAAVAYLIMAFLDAVAMHFTALRVFSLRLQGKIYIPIAASTFLLIIPFQLNGLLDKIIFIILFSCVFIAFNWKYLLDEYEKNTIYNKLKFFFRKYINN